MRRLHALMPKENIIYFGDTSRVPYGTRGRDTIIKYARQDVAFLRQFDLKAIIIACNTVSSVALDPARRGEQHPHHRHGRAGLPPRHEP